MPAVQYPCKVLVSGANGYVAIKGEHPRKEFAKYGEKFEVVVVEDITKEGAFDEAVRGVDAIAHTASPFHLNAQYPGELIEPAVKGTIGMLRSALNHGSSVKRIVITGSVAAIVHDDITPTTFTEKDWNHECLELVKTQGENASNLMKYRASKTLAEQATWKFVEDHKQQIRWDLAVLNAPLVFGPAIHELRDPASLNTSAKIFYDYVADASKVEEVGNEFLSKNGSCWVDVRDLAEAHRLALEKEEAGGERIIISASVFKWQDFIDAANALSPPIVLSRPLPKGMPGSGSGQPDTVHLISYDTTKSDRILGLKYRSIADTTEATLANYAARGW